jgi:hypothetical protein
LGPRLPAIKLLGDVAANLILAKRIKFFEDGFVIDLQRTGTLLDIDPQP